MPSYQKTLIVGHAGRDAEFKDVGPGLARFSVAVSERYQKNGEWQDDTTWYSVEVWDKYAQKLVGKVKKGDLVMVEGKCKADSYESGGETRVSLVLKAWVRDVTCFTKHEPAAAKVADDDDGLPF